MVDDARGQMARRVVVAAPRHVAGQMRRVLVAGRLQRQEWVPRPTISAAVRVGRRAVRLDEREAGPGAAPRPASAASGSSRVAVPGAGSLAVLRRPGAAAVGLAVVRTGVRPVGVLPRAGGLARQVVVAPAPILRSQDGTGFVALTPRATMQVRSFAPGLGVVDRAWSKRPAGAPHAAPVRVSEQWRQGAAGFSAASQDNDLYAAAGLKEADSAATFGRMFEDYMALQARLPPAGGAAFDPRLTPSWAGVKLPL